MLTSRRNHSFGGFRKSKERTFSAPRRDKSARRIAFLTPGWKGKDWSPAPPAQEATETQRALKWKEQREK